MGNNSSSRAAAIGENAGQPHAGGQAGGGAENRVNSGGPGDSFFHADYASRYRGTPGLFPQSRTDGSSLLFFPNGPRQVLGLVFQKVVAR